MLEVEPFDPSKEYKPTWWERRSKWLDTGYYRYLLRIPNQKEGDHPLGWTHNNHLVDYFIRIWCRLHDHPNGRIYYNPSGHEPDDHCGDCGDEI